MLSRTTRALGPSLGRRGLEKTRALWQVLPAAHLVDVVQFEVFEEQQEQGRDALHDDLLVPVHVDAQLHALEDSDATMGTGVRAGTAGERPP